MSHLESVSSLQQYLGRDVGGRAAHGVQRPPHLHRQPEVGQLQPAYAAVCAHFHLFIIIIINDPICFYCLKICIS